MGDKRAEWIIRKDWSEVSQRLKLLSREGTVDVVRSAEVETPQTKGAFGEMQEQRELWMLTRRQRAPC